MESVLNNSMFNTLTMDEMLDVEGGGWATTLGCIAVGVIGIVAGPPAIITGSVAVFCWYAGSTLIATAGVLSAVGK